MRSRSSLWRILAIYRRALQNEEEFKGDIVLMKKISTKSHKPTFKHVKSELRVKVIFFLRLYSRSGFGIA